MNVTNTQWIIIFTFIFVNVGSLVTVWSFLYAGFRRKLKEDVLSEYMTKELLKKEYYSKGEMYDKFVSMKHFEMTLAPFTESMREDMAYIKKKMDALQESNLRFLEIQAAKHQPVKEHDL